MTETLERPVAQALDEAGRALLFTEARTASTWADTPVTDEELSAIWELARWAPTSANTQPLRVLYVHPGENPWYGRLPRLDHEDVISWA